MARKQSPGIMFYRMDCGHVRNDKVRLLMNEFDSDGYYIWSCLLDYGYYKWGYYFDTNDKDILDLFASEYCRKKLPLVKEVINGCLRRGLFDKAVFEMSGILTCTMMQEVFMYASIERRKKGGQFEMKQEWLLINLEEFTSTGIVLNSSKNDLSSREESTYFPGKNPQTETKTEIKLKQQTIASDKPKPPVLKVVKGKVDKKKVDISEPHWNTLVKIWFDFNIEKFLKKNPGAHPKSGEPSFAGTPNPRVLKKIIGRLRFRSESISQEWTEMHAAATLKAFLIKADEDRWLTDNFLLSNLDKQFDKIVLNKSTHGNQNRQDWKNHTNRAVITGAAESAGTL